MNTKHRFQKYAVNQGECIIWTANVPTLWDGNGNVLPHRWAYEQKHGRKPEFIMKRTCGTKGCINPDHFTSPNEIFWTRMDKRENGCWEWTGPITHNGYGYVGRKIERLAHRMAWRLTHGDILDGLFVLHKCDNPRCCNPEHLFLGTAADNMRDMHSKGRANPPKGEDSGTAKLTEAQVREIHKRIKNGDKIPAMAKEFKVTKEAIYSIAGGINWAHLGLEKISLVIGGENNGHAKLTDETARQAYEEVRSGKGVTYTARQFGVSPGTISEICNGKKWRHLNLVPLNIGSRKGEDTNTAKLNDDKVREIRRLFEAGSSIKYLAQTYGVSVGNMQSIISGKTWRHVK